jgi:ketosteroid isomerase-like protein
MSKENVERFVQRMYDTFNVEGVGAAERFWDAQVEYHDDPQWPGGSAHHGRDAVAARFLEVIQVLGIEKATVERVVEAGDDELAWIVRYSGRSTGEGVPNDHTWGYVGRISNGRLIYFRAYYQPAQALEAVGLTE